MKYTRNLNDSTYILFENEVDLGSSFMVVQIHFKNLIFLLVKEILNGPNKSTPGGI